MQRGAKLHSNSGAGRVKDDGHDDTNQYEVKDARKTHTLKVKDLKALLVRSIRLERDPVFIIYWSDEDITMECHLSFGGKQALKE